MTKETLQIEIAIEDLGLFNQLVAQYGQGDPSKFLTFAIKFIARDRMRQKLQMLQQEARDDMGGKVYTTDETQRLIKGT
jgi:hypothetical protein